MKKTILLYSLLLLPVILFSQNLISDGTFSTQTGEINGSTTPWKGYGFGGTKTTVISSDNLIGSAVGQLGNGDAALRQDFTVTSQTIYQVNFDYRWVTTSSAITISLRRLTPTNTAITTFTPNTTPDVWHKGTITFTSPADVTTVRLQFYHASGSAMRVDNVSVRKLHTFNGNTDSDISTASNWDTNEIPDDDDIIIPTGKNAVLNGNLTNGNLSIEGTGTLTINPGGSLVVATGSNVNGNITYKRTLQGGKWHLVTPPVVGATYNDTWVTENGIEISGSGNRGISAYQNGTADPTTGPWVYVQAGGSGTFETSKGYALRRTSTGDVSFTGTYPTGARPFSASIGSSSAFNLVGNPYPMYLSLANFYSVNPTAKFTEETIWIWDQATNSYLQKTSALDGSFQIAPGQAFFVSSGNGTDVIFYQYLGSHSTDSFLKSSKTQTTVKVASDNAISSTELYYLPEGTSDFDNGYDASKFTGVATNFDIYTTQLSNASKKLGRQVVSLTDLESLVIPLGIKAAAGKELTFTAEAMNLPNGIKIYLEDRETNTIIRLDEPNSSYKVTLNTAMDGIGRFYLHTKSSSVLSTEDINVANVSIFKSAPQNLKIVGVNAPKVTFKLFNMLGKQVFEQSFASKGVSEISLPKMATGVYVVQLSTENTKLSKKIILE